MKKLLTVALCLVLALLSFGTVGCKKDNRLIRLNEVTHSIFYAPMYIAINNGYFADLDIRIQLTNGQGATNVMTAIASNSADIGLLGAEATVYCHVEGQKDYPIIFGQLTQRDGSFLVGRTAEPDFKWSNLEGKHLMAGRPGGMPAMTLQYVVENVGGLNLNQLNFDTSVDFALMIPTFESDTKYDYCTMFEPSASEFVAAGKGHIVASVGAASGDVPYTSFSASKSYLKNNKGLVEDFLRAIKMGRDFMQTATDSQLVASLAPSFAGVSDEMILASIKSYLAIDAWSSDMVFSAESFNKLQDIMENAGYLTSRASHALAVDNSIALGLKA